MLVLFYMDNHLLEQKINYTFKEQALLQLALTHCSFSAEHGIQNNQRLEFLGDAVVDAVICSHIYHRYPSFDEGKLTRLRVSIVSEEPLALAAEELELNRFILLGVGEKASGGANKPGVLSDTLEALFAAVYLDGGYSAAEEVILRVLKNVMTDAKKRPLDYKTTLQEKLAQDGPVNIVYTLLSMEGPPHSAVFETEVSCNGEALGRGKGSSKKRAEQDAARQALKKIEK